MRRWIATLVLAALAQAGSGCSDSQCQSTFKKICSRACACPNSDNKCAVKLSSITFSFDDSSDCKLLLTSSCDDSRIDLVDLDACSRDVELAQCIPPSATVKGSFPVPDSCNPPRADAGP